MTTPGVDQTYLRLYREYSRALREWNIAVQERNRRLAARRAWEATPHPRRPVGAPADFRFSPPEAPREPKPLPRPRYYMGRILGWVEWQYRPQPDEVLDPDPALDARAVLDEIALKDFLRTRNRYLEARRSFFEYARRQNRRTRLSRMADHNRLAREAAKDAARSFQLGRDAEGEAALEALKEEVDAMCREAWAAYGRTTFDGTTPREHRAQARVLVEAAQEASEVGSEGEVERMLMAARMQIEAACEKAWDAYRRAPTPRSEDAVRRMIELLEEAQILGAESSTIASMELEVTRMLRAPGRLEAGHPPGSRR